MSILWSDHLERLSPYVPGEQVSLPDLLRLNTNENPYGPSPRALQAMRDHLNDDLRLYPDARALRLRQAIADHHGLSIDQVFVGNGSDEVLGHLFNAFFLRSGRPLWLPDITYSFYLTYCKLYDVPFERIALDDDFGLRVSDYTRQPATPPCGIIFANPNAPTGRALSLGDIRLILQAHPDATVVVDEAYVDFGAETAVALIAEHPNLLIVQTFSKSRALAGMRVGFAMGQAELVQALERVKNSFNSYPLGQLAQVAAEAALADHDWFEQTRQAIMTDRNVLARRLADLEFTVLPSLTNFLFARHHRHSAADLAARLREHGILLRHFQMPRIDNYLRITVGTAAQCERLADTLQTILK